MLHNNIAAEIFDCFTYYQPEGIKYNTPRNYCALAFRKDTESKYTFDEKTITAPKGAVVFVPDGVSYSTKSNEGKIYVIHFYIHNRKYKDIEILSTENSEIYSELFKDAMITWSEKLSGYQYKLASIFYKILESITVNSQNDSYSKHKLARKCRDYINENFTRNDFNIAELAEKNYVTEAYVRRKFKERYKISPMEYLNNKRIEHAKYLLDTEYFSQSEIAEKCGYSDVKYFRFAFKRETGKSIRAYKNDIK